MFHDVMYFFRVFTSLSVSENIMFVSIDNLMKAIHTTIMMPPKIHPRLPPTNSMNIDPMIPRKGHENIVYPNHGVTPSVFNNSN